MPIPSFTTFSIKVLCSKPWNYKLWDIKRHTFAFPVTSNVSEAMNFYKVFLDFLQSTVLPALLNMTHSCLRVAVVLTYSLILKFRSLVFHKISTGRFAHPTN